MTHNPYYVAEDKNVGIKLCLIFQDVAYDPAVLAGSNYVFLYGADYNGSSYDEAKAYYDAHLVTSDQARQAQVSDKRDLSWIFTILLVDEKLPISPSLTEQSVSRFLLNSHARRTYNSAHYNEPGAAELQQGDFQGFLDKQLAESVEHKIIMKGSLDAWTRKMRQSRLE